MQPVASDAIDDADRGPGRGGPQRTCIATRQVRPVGELIRFVVGPDGALVPDLKGRLPGRGVWVSGEAGALRTAIERKAFARSLKRSLDVPGSLVDDTERLLAQGVLDALAIAGISNVTFTVNEEE